MVASSNVRKHGAKVRALIASDQAIFQSLPPGSAAANQLDARIQATVTMYASQVVLPAARRGAAIMGVISLALLAGSLTMALKNHSSQGDQFVYPFASGFMAANLGLCLARSCTATSRRPHQTRRCRLSSRRLSPGTMTPAKPRRRQTNPSSPESHPTPLEPTQTIALMPLG
jgi:hypothetical protein